jgi:hypothetical protein
MILLVLQALLSYSSPLWLSHGAGEKDENFTLHQNWRSSPKPCPLFHSVDLLVLHRRLVQKVREHPTHLKECAECTFHNFNCCV